MKDLGILKKIYDLSIPYIKLSESKVKSTHIRSFDSKLDLSSQDIAPNSQASDLNSSKE